MLCLTRDTPRRLGRRHAWVAVRGRWKKVKEIKSGMSAMTSPELELAAKRLRGIEKRYGDAVPWLWRTMDEQGWRSSAKWLLDITRSSNSSEAFWQALLAVGFPQA